MMRSQTLPGFVPSIWKILQSVTGWASLHEPQGTQGNHPDEWSFFDPAEFIDQLVLLARVLLFIPHNSTLCLPAHIDSCRKARIRRIVEVFAAVDIGSTCSV